jgi:hydroxymethylpyrimidine pyrophosphatase-like HAD family hydrolase
LPLEDPPRATGARKLLAIDLDGTLLDGSGRPHARDVRAVQAALAAGVSVSIVTGRLYSGSRATAEVLGLRGAVGCADGSHVVRASDHTTLLHRGVCGAEAVALRRALSNAKAATFVFARDAIGHDAAGTPYIGYMSTWSNDVRIAPDVFEHDLWAAEEGITAVVALGAREPLEQAVRDLQRDAADGVFIALFPLRRGAHMGMWAVMVRAGAVTKGTAIRWIAEREGVALDDTVCVGDWINDIPMFEVAGRSFAMGQSPDEVKSRATDHLVETAETGGGVATAIEQAFGIRGD